MLFTLGEERVKDSNPDQEFLREEKAVKEFCFHFEITELRREEEERQRVGAGCSVGSRHAEFCVFVL